MRGGLLTRLMTVVAIAAMVIASAAILDVRVQAAGDEGTIVNDGVALFAGRDDQSVIATMYAGERVDVLWGPDNGLYEVRYYGLDGWVWAESLSVDGGGDVASAATWNGGNGDASAVVNTDSLSVRTDASFDAGIIDYFAGGTAVMVIGDPVNGFAPIAYGGGVAWVYVDYLDWDGSIAYSDLAVGGATSPLPETTNGAEHWIDVDRNTGAVTLYIGDVPQATYWGSLSYDTSDGGFYTTASGTFYVFRKYEPLAYTPYADAYITDWVGFDSERDNGFHSWTRGADGTVLPNGAGNTAGCVGLEPSAAQAVYDFSFIGMRVVVHN